MRAIMAITGLPIGKALRHRGLARLAIATIREGVRTAQAGGYALDQSRRARTFRAMALLPFAISSRLFGPRLAGSFPPDSTYGPSTLQSLRRGSSSELDYLMAKAFSALGRADSARVYAGYVRRSWSGAEPEIRALLKDLP